MFLLLITHSMRFNEQQHHKEQFSGVTLHLIFRTFVIQTAYLKNCVYNNQFLFLFSFCSVVAAAFLVFSRYATVIAKLPKPMEFKVSEGTITIVLP